MKSITVIDAYEKYFLYDYSSYDSFYGALIRRKKN